VPLCGPADRADRPAGLSDTLMDDGTVPLGVAESQEDAAPVYVVKFTPDVPVTFTLCDPGMLPPIT
jgi:hypothetical protein